MMCENLSSAFAHICNNTHVGTGALQCALARVCFGICHNIRLWATNACIDLHHHSQRSNERARTTFDDVYTNAIWIASDSCGVCQVGMKATLPTNDKTGEHMQNRLTIRCSLPWTHIYIYILAPIFNKTHFAFTRISKGHEDSIGGRALIILGKHLTIKLAVSYVMFLPCSKGRFCVGIECRLSACKHILS